MIELTDKNWDELVKLSSIPILVDFYSPECNPCKTMFQQLEKLQAEVTSCAFGKLNIYDYPEIATDCDVMGMPTLLLFINGEVAKTQLGVGTYDQLKEFVNA